MKVVVGNQTFDSKRVPVALVMTEAERCACLMNYAKPEGEFHTFVHFPGDIDLMALQAWVKENVPEFKGGDMKLQATGKLP